MQTLLNYAQRARDDAAQNGTIIDTRYWAGYIDGVTAAIKKAEYMAHQLELARAERDVITKRMIQLEQELAQIKEGSHG